MHPGAALTSPARLAHPACLASGDFVVEYCGEVIDELELQLRMEVAGLLANPHYYIMELQPGLFIDARNKGNQARLLNSSCDPNCETQKWQDAATGEVRSA
jgi:SET domain-containing protein